MTRVAAIDCGTNSIRLLIADWDGRTLHELCRETTIVRLGEGVDATGEFAPAALQRTFAAIEEFTRLLATHRPTQLRFVATSASRDVSNRQDFADGVYDRLGVLPEVITGAEEAELSFVGATSATSAQAPYLVIDLGGGSTEFVLGRDSVEAAISVDMGSVRMSERFLLSDPPTSAELADLDRAIEDSLDEVGQRIEFSSVRTLIGVAGTITTVAAAVLDLPSYQRERIDGAVLPVPAIAGAAQTLVSTTCAQRKGFPYMQPGRADVIPAGARIFAAIVARVDKAVTGPELEVLVSESDILDGTAITLARSCQ